MSDDIQPQLEEQNIKLERVQQSLEKYVSCENRFLQNGCMGLLYFVFSYAFIPLSPKKQSKSCNELDWELPVSCLQHQDEETPLSVFSTTQQVNLPGCTLYCPFNAER